MHLYLKKIIVNILQSFFFLFYIIVFYHVFAVAVDIRW
jgi:hypothetical protein